jgi:hypothetical protein
VKNKFTFINVLYLVVIWLASLLFTYAFYRVGFFNIHYNATQQDIYTLYIKGLIGLSIPAIMCSFSLWMVPNSGFVKTFFVLNAIITFWASYMSHSGQADIHGITLLICLILSCVMATITLAVASMEKQEQTK